MYQHRNLVGIHSKQPMSLNNLKALVYKCSRVDGNLRTHRPLRMLERTLWSDILKLRRWHITQCSATAGHYQSSYGRLLTHQTLEDSRVLGVNRQDRHSLLGCHTHHQVTTYNQSLLICQSNLLARLNSCNRRKQTRIANQSIHNHIDLRRAHHLLDGITTRINLDWICRQRLLELEIFILIADDHRIDIELNSLTSQKLPVVTRHKRVYLKHIGVLTHNIQRLHTDRARRTKY